MQKEQNPGVTRACSTPTSADPDAIAGPRHSGVSASDVVVDALRSHGSRIRTNPIPGDIDPVRFWRRVDKTPGCWRWIGHVNAEGYGKFHHAGRWYTAHRVAWTVEVGPIPAGLVSDHKCRHRDCVNPRHIELVTPRENAARGRGAAAAHIRSWTLGFCQRGHEIAVVGVHKRGKSRVCAQCSRDAVAAYRKRVAR